GCVAGRPEGPGRRRGGAGRGATGRVGRTVGVRGVDGAGRGGPRDLGAAPVAGLGDRGGPPGSAGRPGRTKPGPAGRPRPGCGLAGRPRRIDGDPEPGGARPDDVDHGHRRVPLGAVVTLLTTDLVAHTWDVGHALGRDVRLDPALVTLAFDWARAHAV